MPSKWDEEASCLHPSGFQTVPLPRGEGPGHHGIQTMPLPKGEGPGYHGKGGTGTASLFPGLWNSGSGQGAFQQQPKVRMVCSWHVILGWVPALHLPVFSTGESGTREVSLPHASLY